MLLFPRFRCASPWAIFVASLRDRPKGQKQILRSPPPNLPQRASLSGAPGAFGGPFALNDIAEVCGSCLSGNCCDRFRTSLRDGCIDCCFSQGFAALHPGLFSSRPYGTGPKGKSRFFAHHPRTYPKELRSLGPLVRSGVRSLRMTPLRIVTLETRPVEIVLSHSSCA